MHRNNAVPEEATSSLFIRLGPSRRLTAVLGGLHLGAIVCVFAADLPITVRAFVALCVLLAGVRCVALHGSRRSAGAIVLLVWDRRGHWRVLQRNGRLLDVHLLPGAYTHPQLVVLRFRTSAGRRLRVLMAADMVDADHLRRLRVRLRCEPAAGP